MKHVLKSLSRRDYFSDLLVQSTRAASYAAEAWYEFEFEFIKPGDGLYRRKHGLEGTTGTRLVSEETLLDAVPTVTLSGLSGTFFGPQGDLAVSLPAGVVQDSNGIPNAASNQITALNQIVEHTSQLIAGYMQARTNNLVSNQPRLADLLLGRGTGNQLNAAVTRGQLNMDMVIAPKGGAWGTIRAAFSESDGQDSGYALATFGRHVEVKPNLLLRAMLQLDYAETSEGATEVDGYGWLVGSYAVYRLPDQPVIFSAHMLYGQSNNDIAPLGTYRDQFKTERWLARWASPER